MRKTEYTCDYCGQPIEEKKVNILSLDVNGYLWYEVHKECKDLAGEKIKSLFIYRTDRK